jgi:hypothetical protein
MPQTKPTSEQVTFLQAGTGATQRTALAKLRDTVSVKDFGAVGDGVADDTAAMQAAHNTGKIVYYNAGRYKFSRITMVTGGIVGDSLATILDSTDTTTGDVIYHSGGDSTGLLVNELGAIFENFYLRVNTVTQKASGNGIKINPSGSEMNLRSNFHNVTIRNIPTSVYLYNTTYVNISDCYFAFYSNYGIFTDNNALFGDNGDNGIYNNNFYTNRPNAIGIKYRTGGARIINNKIKGGYGGIEFSPVQGTSVVLVSTNSIESQTNYCIKITSEADCVATAFGRVNISNNQLNATSAVAAAIIVNPTYYQLTDLIICGNVVHFFTDLANAIDIRNTNRFNIYGNNVECNSLGYRGFFISSTCLNGQLTENTVFNYTNAHTLNQSSATCIQTQTVGIAVSAIDPASIADGAGTTFVVAVTNAALGNIAMASYSLDIQGITVTAWVSSAGNVSVRFQNETGAPIDLAAGNLAVRVVRQ